jgi:(p)ppGpp synthase/HD superfamily hydrolase
MADETLKNPLTDRFTDALSFACDLHRLQSRKATQIPYVSHLLAVASLVLEHGGGEDEAIGALLHDAVEDQDGLPTLERIRQRFGPEVAAFVEGCTDAVVVPKPPWRERKIAYIANVATKPVSVRRVSSADKLHNARAILADYRVHGEALWGRFNGGREGTLWYYRELYAAFAKAEDNALARELALTIGELERLAAKTQPARETPP